MQRFKDKENTVIGNRFHATLRIVSLLNLILFE